MESQHSMQEQYLKVIKQIIGDNIDNESFSVAHLAREVGLSRSMLHRKLIRLTGKSATELITEIRLTKALELLENDAGTVSEIAYLVGYSSPSYFNKVFKKTYNVSPGDVRRKGSGKVSHLRVVKEPGIPGAARSKRSRSNVIAGTSILMIIIIILGAVTLLLGVMDNASPFSRLPEWTVYLFLAILIVGFIIAMILSWIYNIHSEGDVDMKESVPKSKSDYFSISSYNWKIVSYISFSVIIGLIILNIFLQRNRSVSPESPLKSIAVLPFEDMSPGKDQDYFCDGITEEIINSISHIEGISVIARTSTFVFKEQYKDIRDIGKQLDVETILVGSVQKEGTRIRVIARLVNTKNGSNIWSDRFDRELDELFLIQYEIAQAIADNLRAELLGSVKHIMMNRQTDNLEAYNLYLKGRHSWYWRNEEDQKRSIVYFNKAIAIDSNYALAYAGLADAYTIMAWHGFYPRDEGFQKGKEYAHKALSINKNLAEVHATLGIIANSYDWNWEESEKQLRKAISLNPNYATARLWYAELLDILCRNEEARQQMNYALRLNPYAQVFHHVSSVCYYNTGDFESSIMDNRRALEFSEHPHARLMIFTSYVNLNRDEKAIDFLKEFVSLYDADDNVSLYNEIYMNEGMAGVIRRFISWSMENEKDVNRPNLVNYNYAYLSALAGDTEKTIEYLEKGLLKHESVLLRINNNPDFDIVRQDPRFRGILRHMHLTN